MEKYQLKEDYLAHYVGGQIGMKKTLSLLKGKIIEAEKFTPPPNKAKFKNIEPSVTYTGYLIPLSLLDPLPVSDGKEDLVAEEYVVGHNENESNGAYKIGLLVGAIVGLGLGLKFGGSKLFWMAGGALGGSFLFSSLADNKPKESKFKPLNSQDDV